MTLLRCDPLAPGSTIGVLGGGQLGRMTAMAAARLGYRVHVFGDDPDGPAAQVAAAATIAGFDDPDALARFAAACDVVTFEWENIPAAAAAAVAALRPVRPDPAVLAATQDRIAEKTVLNRSGCPTAPWRPVHERADLTAAAEALGYPLVLKSARLGYDGKGQAFLAGPADQDPAWTKVGGGPAIAEGFVDFAAEISVIVARGLDGTLAAFPPVENRHRNHILVQTLYPARVVPGALAAADAIARRITEALAVVGLLAVEMFVTRDGAVLVNELAPRPHNSGHWTIDAAVTSQFEQLVRAICGLPLGAPQALGPAEMINLLGEDAARWREYLADPNAHLHLYGKRESRPGRKMGHVTRLLLRTPP